MNLDSPNVRMVDKFGRGRVYIAGGETTTQLSSASTDIFLVQMQPSMYCKVYLQATCNLASQRP